MLSTNDFGIDRVPCEDKYLSSDITLDDKHFPSCHLHLFDKILSSDITLDDKHVRIVVI